MGTNRSTEAEYFCPHCSRHRSVDRGGAGQGSGVAPSPDAPQVAKGNCLVCGFPVAAYDSLNAPSKIASGSAAREPVEFQNAGSMIRLEDSSGVIVGRGPDAVEGFSRQAFRHRGVESRHFAVLRGDGGSVWLVGLTTGVPSLFLDGRRVWISKLPDGAVVQAGPLAWQFNAAKRVLTPVTPIAGFNLAVDAEVESRLTRTRLEIRRGEMTALVGPSGCGKSTLLETIRDGSGLEGEADTQGLVYFVPQQDLVHHDLRLRDALQTIGKIYGRDVLPFEIDAALDSVGMPVSAKNKFPRELSGGQLRRFRIAGALLSGAGVIVLDEPDSGLDHETADEVISLLHSLAIRGATVVAVTHHRHVLDYFDRVISMRPTPDGGEVVDDQVHDDQGVIRGSRRDLPSDSETEDVPEELAEQNSDPSRPGPLRMLSILIRREQLKLTSPVLSRLTLGPIRIPSCLIGLLLVPLLFALSVAVSVPTDPERDVADGIYGEMLPIARLGFLAVVSVIWMSASGSHLSVTRQRRLYDYERSHGISWMSILSSKSFVLIAAGMIQTLLFALMLYLIREVWLDRSFFVDERWTQLAGVVLCLLAVSVASTMLGILVSSLAGKAPLIATAVLPVIMMFQILFSAPFAVSNPDGYEPLADYDRLTIFEQGDEIDDEDDEAFWEDEEDEVAKPLWATSFLSYTTLSRYGDKWIRSSAVTIDPPESAATCQWTSAAALAVSSAVCFCASLLVVWMQSTRLSIRRGAASTAGAILAFALVIGAGGKPIVSAQSPGDGVQSEAETPTIRVPLVDGKYDENRLLRALGGSATGEPRWREFGNQDRIGLVALELVGKIEFSLSERELSIKLNDMPKWELMKQLAPPRLLTTGTVAEAGDVLLFVHGLEGGESTFASAARTMQRDGIASMRFEFPNDGPPDEIGGKLSELLTEWAEDHDDIRIHIVAHSLGGLISTWAVTEPGFPTSRVPNVFTLGTPFRGSALASFHDELELFDVMYRLATFTPGALDTIADGRGEAAIALRPGSSFLRQLHARSRPPEIEFHLAAGTKSFLSNSRRDRLAAELPADLARLAISEDYAKRIGKLLAAEELRDGKGDGAVTVESALGLQNPASTRTFSLSHTALVSSDEPLEWVREQAGVAEPGKPGPK